MTAATILAALLALTSPTDETEGARLLRLAGVAVATEQVSDRDWMAAALVATIDGESDGALEVHDGRRRSSTGASCLTQIAPGWLPLTGWSEITGIGYEQTLACVHLGAFALVTMRDHCLKRNYRTYWAEAMFAAYQGHGCSVRHGRYRASVMRRVQSTGWLVTDAMRDAIEVARAESEPFLVPEREPGGCDGLQGFTAPSGWQRAGNPATDARRYSHRFLGAPLGSWHTGARWGYLVEQHCDDERGRHKGVSVFQKVKARIR